MRNELFLIYWIILKKKLEIEQIDLFSYIIFNFFVLWEHSLQLSQHHWNFSNQNKYADFGKKIRWEKFIFKVYLERWKCEFEWLKIINILNKIDKNLLFILGYCTRLCVSEWDCLHISFNFKWIEKFSQQILNINSWF